MSEKISEEMKNKLLDALCLSDAEKNGHVLKWRAAGLLEPEEVKG